jgi:hypothetical protein
MPRGISAERRERRPDSDACVASLSCPTISCRLRGSAADMASAEEACRGTLQPVGARPCEAGPTEYASAAVNVAVHGHVHMASCFDRGDKACSLLAAARPSFDRGDPRMTLPW